MRAYNFFVSGQSSPIFFVQRGDESPLIMSFTTCWYLYAFQRYLQSKSEVCLHCTEFWTFFVFQNFKL